MNAHSLRLRAALVFVAISCLSAPALLSQPIYYVGGGGGYAYNWHRTTQPINAQEPGCDNFANGDGSGLYFFLGGENILLPWLRGSLRLTYAEMHGTLNKLCDNGIIVPVPGTNEFAPLVREHVKDVRLGYGLLELGVKAYPLDLPAFVGLGASIGTPMFSSTFDQTERVVSPEGTLFPGNVVRRKTGGGEIPSTQLRSALIGSLGYDVKIRKNVEVSPELSYTHSFSDVAGENWKVQAFRAGVSVKWRLDLAKPPEPPKVEPPPPPPPPPVKPVATIGTTKDASIHVLETYVTETFPLLPYIFFDNESDSLRQRYTRLTREETYAYEENALPRKTIGIYYQFLNIVGFRMRNNADITITLIGASDGKETHTASKELAARRVARIKEYLTSVWGIDSSRIAASVQDLPPFPSTSLFPEGDEENRRVVIQSGSDEIFRPIIHQRFKEYAITPTRMQLSLGSKAVFPITAWAAEVRYKGVVVRSFDGFGQPPDSVGWDLTDSLAESVTDRETLVATLTITDSLGQTGTGSVSIPIFKTLNNYEVGRLSLIVFDFDKADILPHNERMIRKFVGTAIASHSGVEITGSTDGLGEEEHNMELSTARASNVRGILASERPSTSDIKAKGIGEADLYDNFTPEGRFYCRTVAVEVRTPMQ